VPCSTTGVCRRRDKLREPLLATMIPLLAMLDQALLVQTHTEAETLALIRMEVEILVRADMEEPAETTITTTKYVVLV